MSNYTGLYLRIPNNCRDLRSLESPLATILHDMNSSIAEDEVMNVSLAVHEVCLHLISQNDEADTPITVVVEPREQGCEIRVSALASTKQAASMHGHAGDCSFQMIGNLGLWLAKRLVDEISMEQTAECCRWKLTKHAT